MGSSRAPLLRLLPAPEQKWLLRPKTNRDRKVRSQLSSDRHPVRYDREKSSGLEQDGLAGFLMRLEGTNNLHPTSAGLTQVWRNWLPQGLAGVNGELA